MDAIQRIGRKLQETIGMDYLQWGTNLLQRPLSCRMKALNVHHIEDYLTLIDSSVDEWNIFIELVIVPETWFFRNCETFYALVEWASQWFATHSSGRLNILSLPCSSGEEPYSIAMTLLNAGFDPGRFRIVGGDISNIALETAQKAIYSQKAFRGKSLHFWETYFVAPGDRRVLKETVRSQVEFQPMNIFDIQPAQREGEWDVIFFRNLLIYFNEDSQALSFKKLHRMLTEDGILFLGPAEPPLARKAGFHSANYPGAFACLKKKTLLENSLKESAILHRKIEFPPFLYTPALAQNLDGGRLQDDTSFLKESPKQDSLELARQKADKGDLHGAAALLQPHLSEGGATAESYFLAGLVQDCLKHPQAAESYYRRALYLDPEHSDSLMHLTLLLECQERKEEALRLRRRAMKTESL